jgi:hypothetical protein
MQKLLSPDIRAMETELVRLGNLPTVAAWPDAWPTSVL